MLRHIKPTITIIFGAAIFAFGLTYFVVPHHLFEGGATGITLITYYLFNIPISLMNILINIPLFLLAWKIFGLRSLYSSLLGTIAVSICQLSLKKFLFSLTLKEISLWLLQQLVSSQVLDSVLFSMRVEQQVVLISSLVSLINTPISLLENCFLDLIS